ncbi:E3 ubiquitin ligase, partial [Coemansia sp. RSA 2399]
MPLIPSTMPLRSDAFMGHWRDPAGDLDMQHVLEKYDADIGAAADSSHGDTEKTPVDMENYAVDECILRGHITIRSRYNSSDDNSDNDRNVDNDDSCDSDSSSVYEMPDDTIDELRMELYGCNMGEHIPQQPTTNKPSCAEADLRLELSLKDQELSELSSMVESLNAEMLVQRSELQSADIKLSHLETSVQCSICLEPFSQPHSLGCGHTFCMECLKQWLAQSMQCPTCRSSVLQRPSIAYIVQDVLQCLGLGSECRSSPVEVNRRGGGQDPWQQLFPSQSSGNASGSYERCR